MNETKLPLTNIAVFHRPLKISENQVYPVMKSLTDIFRLKSLAVLLYEVSWRTCRQTNSTWGSMVSHLCSPLAHGGRMTSSILASVPCRTPSSNLFLLFVRKSGTEYTSGINSRTSERLSLSKTSVLHCSCMFRKLTLRQSSKHRAKNRMIADENL
jgi:hypothetical protein